MMTWLRKRSTGKRIGLGIAVVLVAALLWTTVLSDPVGRFMLARAAENVEEVLERDARRTSFTNTHLREKSSEARKILEAVERDRERYPAVQVNWALVNAYDDHYPRLIDMNVTYKLGITAWAIAHEEGAGE